MVEMLFGVLLLVMLCGDLTAGQTCQANAPRRDCGYYGIQEPECVQTRGCCWTPTEGQPWCYYKTSLSVYHVDAVMPNKLGTKITLKVNGSTSSQFGDLISPLTMDITMESDERLHVKIYDSNKQRWEIPTDVSPIGSVPSSPPANPLYKITTANKGEPFYFAVTRASDGEVLFNTSHSDQPLQFADQYLTLSTTLPGTESIYGLGEHKVPLQLKRGQTFTLWDFDTPTPPNVNLYGSHPFYMDLRQSGKAHGVYLRNSNGMDVIYGDNFLTYRVIGGVLDFYFFLGPTPEGVVQQYQEVIGRPYLPPYWALGFHQCRYGYPNVEALSDVVTKYAANKIPLDTMWTDIEYMDGYRDFTLDPNNFPLSKMTEFVEGLHNRSLQYVVIVDPGIKVDRGYKAYDDGISKGVFVKDKNGNLFTGKVWPGVTTFPDFFNPMTADYWKDQTSTFYNTLLKFDGLWIDMNEISNFCNGECSGSSHPEEMRRSVDDGLKFDPNNPPYHINNQGSSIGLNTKTLDMDAMHHGGVLEYNSHNLYGLMESIATCSVLESVREGKRCFVISRSTFPGSGAHTGHWTGDNHASYDDLYYSIPEMLSFQMYGIPLVGSDICGFSGDTTEELCSRWMELGAFYPFSRNHNIKGTKPQEPYEWSSVAAISRKMLGLRYSILPYYYTLFYKASRPVTTIPSATVTRPLFFEFPTDRNTHSIDRQFMVGSGLLVSPVLEQGSTSVEAYFPAGKWYDVFTDQVVTTSGGTSLTLHTPIDHIQVHVRGGSIIPGKGTGLTTYDSRNTDSTLVVALDSTGKASGDLYIDDGETVSTSQWMFLLFNATSSGSSGQVISGIAGQAGDPLKIPPLGVVKVLGVGGSPSKASINGAAISGFQFNTTNNVLLLTGINADLTSSFKITWE
ncbi:uncharacterized protein [Dysidea avara]|uniref:uncharacterized protein isoform X1 n=2 Tax=Dysidea avara TaxID=196820 RepID=UPI003321B6A8